MSKTYRMKRGDDVRDMVIDLAENGKALAGNKIPIEAVLKMDFNGELKTRPLQVDGSSVKYRWKDADFDEFGAVIMLAEVYATFSDSSNATFPTNGTLKIIIGEILS